MGFVIKFVVKIIIYGLIICGVRVIIKKCFIEDGGRKNKNEIEINRLKLSKLFFILAVIYSAILIFASSFPSNIHGETLLIVMLILIAFNVVLYFVAIYLWLWKITFSTNAICKKTMWRREKYEFSSINQYSIDKNRNVVISFNDGNKISFGDMEHLSEITSLLKRNNIQFQARVVSETYIVEESVFYRVFSGICILVSCGLLALCTLESSFFGMIMFGGLLIASVIDFGKKLCNKVMVSKNEIKIRQFLRKEKTISVSELKYVKRKIVDNMENVWVYSEDGLLFKYRKSWNNVEMLETIVGHLKQKQ